MMKMISFKARLSWGCRPPLPVARVSSEAASAKAKIGQDKADNHNQTDDVNDGVHDAAFF
jgi:hypothetical protein